MRGALIFLFVVGVTYGIKPSFGGIEGAAIFATKSSTPPDSKVVAIGNPAHHVDFPIGVAGQNVVGTVIHQPLGLKNYRHRLACLKFAIPRNRDVGIFPLIGPFHGQTLVGPENLTVAFQNVSASAADILNIELPTDISTLGEQSRFHSTNRGRLLHYDVTDANPWTMCRYESFPCISHALLNQTQLPDKQNHLSARNEKQEESGQCCKTCEASDAPIYRRFFFALFSFALGLLLIALGGNALYDKRRFLGTALVSCGVIFPALGLGLWFLNSFRWSWDWFL